MADNKRVNIIIQAKDLATKKLKGLVSAMTSLKGLAISGLSFLALKKGFDTVTDAAATQEDAINELNTQLKINGQFSERLSKTLQDQASAIQQVTKFGDEQVLSLQARLLAYGMQADQLDKTTRLTLDLAAAKKIDLKAAADLVGKAFVGETGSLSRYGIVLDASIPKTEKFAAVQKLIGERFGGTAQAQANTYTGRIQQMSNAFGDTLESLGRFITRNKTFNNLIKLTIPLLEGVTGWLDRHRRASEFASAATGDFTDALFEQRKELDEIMNLQAIAGLELELKKLEDRQSKYASKTKETVGAFRQVVALRDEIGLEATARKILDSTAFSKEARVIVDGMVKLNETKTRLDSEIAKERISRSIAEIKAETEKNKTIEDGNKELSQSIVDAAKKLQSELNSLRDSDLQALDRWYAEQKEMNATNNEALLVLDELYVERKGTVLKDAQAKEREIDLEGKTQYFNRLMERQSLDDAAQKEYIDKIVDTAQKEVAIREEVERRLNDIKLNSRREALDDETLNEAERKELLLEAEEEAKRLNDELTDGSKRSGAEVKNIVNELVNLDTALKGVDSRLADDIREKISASFSEAGELLKTLPKITIDIDWVAMRRDVEDNGDMLGEALLRTVQAAVDRGDIKIPVRTVIDTKGFDGE